MKFRNKGTGEIRKAEAREDGIYLWDELTGHWWKYELDLLASSWEYYVEPKEPLIKDEKIRKAVRAWAEALNASEVSYNSCAEYSEGRFEAEMGMADIDFGRVIGLEDGNYTIAELCGEGEE